MTVDSLRKTAERIFPPSEEQQKNMLLMVGVVEAQIKEYEETGKIESVFGNPVNLSGDDAVTLIRSTVLTLAKDYKKAAELAGTYDKPNLKDTIEYIDSLDPVYMPD